jgi:hypothetical protein
VQLMATEFNSVGYDPGKESTSLVDGLSLAESLGSMLNSGYVNADVWSLRAGWAASYNNSGSLYGWREGGDYGILGSGNQAPDSGTNEPYPSYFAEELASKIIQTGGQVVSVSTNYQGFDAYGVLEADGHLDLLVINTNPAASLSEQFNLAGFQTNGQATFWQYGEAQDTAQSESSTGAAALANFSATLNVNGDSFTYSFPAYSMTVIDLAPQSALAVTSVAVNGSTAPILSAAAAGGTVTITTDGPSGFAAGQNVLIAGVDGTGAASGYNGAYVIASVSGNTFTYTDAGAAGSSTGGGTATTNAATGILTNGATDFTSQRSMVDSIVYTFNQAVNLGVNAIAINVLGQGGQVPTVAYASPDGGFTWVVTFSGSSVIGNSIANGEYQIVLNASAVTAVSGPGAPGLAGNDTESLYRLYGDTEGNGYQKVASADTNTFLGAFNTKSTQAAFLAYLDFEDDGKINSADTNAFLGGFNIAYKNFTATI